MIVPFTTREAAWAFYNAQRSATLRKLAEDEYIVFSPSIAALNHATAQPMEPRK